MNTNRKEIARFREIGIFTELGRELIKRGVVFEYIYTGGNIYLIHIGNQEEKHILISEDGQAFLYSDPDETDFVQLATGHACFYVGSSCNCTEAELIKLSAEIACKVSGSIASCAIDQTIVPARQNEYGLAVF